MHIIIHTTLSTHFAARKHDIFQSYRYVGVKATRHDLAASRHAHLQKLVVVRHCAPPDNTNVTLGFAHSPAVWSMPLSARQHWPLHQVDI